MRSLAIAAFAAFAGALSATPAAAHDQRVITRYDAPQAMPPRIMLPRVDRHERWGDHVAGRWSGGARAPGGWSAYRRPVRGWTLPSYWVAPDFYIPDFAVYGLSRPAPGQSWSRYYDDAVLIDDRGRIWDSVSGVEWDRDGRWDSYGAGYGDDGSYDDRVAYDGHYAPRRDTGVGGAVAGAVVGGVAGNVIAGRGNRLGGTLIGAGVGAVAGYAIDSAGDRGRRPPPPPRYGAGYGYPGPQYRGAPPPMDAPRYDAPRYAPPPYAAPCSSSCTTMSGGGYVRDGWWIPPVTTTVVTIHSAPVTTTTTEYVRETVYRAPVRRVYRAKRTWRPRGKLRQCLCR